MKKSFLLLAILAALAPCFPVATNAATQAYDLKADWSDTQNPNGGWAYNQGATPLPHQDCWAQNCSAPFTCCVPAWARANGCGSTPGLIPAWAKTPACDFTNVYDLQAGDIFTHSRDDANGAGNGEGNITWTATASGLVTVSGGVWDAAKFLGRGNHWRIYHNEILLTEGDVLSNDPYSRAMPFDFQAGSGDSEVLRNISVNAGDVITLLITRTSQYGNVAGVNFTITLATDSVDPVTAIEALAETVVAMNLQNGIENSLDSKLDAAINALIDANFNNDGAACNSLAAFISAVEAQRGKKITNAQADQLIASAQQIRALLSCGN